MERQKNFSRKPRKKEKKKYPWHLYAVLAFAVTAVVLLSFTAAKYQTFFQTGNGQLKSEAFYFTTDLTGDGAMVDSAGENPQGGYQYQDVQEGSFHLYGGGRHEITISLRNYYDELRVNEKPIEYSIKAEAFDRDGKKIENLASLQMGGNTAAVGTDAGENGSTEQSGGTELTGMLSGNADDKKAEQPFLLQIKSHEEMKYDEGTTVAVTIESKKPYKKTIKLSFTLYKVDTYLSYEIRDQENSPYAELVIMTNVIGGDTAGKTGVQPILQWEKGLFIDNTNSLTFTHTENGFKQVAGLEARSIRVSQELNAGESQTIYFFKANRDENFSREQTIVEPKNDQYIIYIGK